MRSSDEESRAGAAADEDADWNETDDQDDEGVDLAARTPYVSPDAQRAGPDARRR
jgi:hypothetical protein